MVLATNDEPFTLNKGAVLAEDKDLQKAKKKLEKYIQSDDVEYSDDSDSEEMSLSEDSDEEEETKTTEVPENVEVVKPEKIEAEESAAEQSDDDNDEQDGQGGGQEVEITPQVAPEPTEKKTQKPPKAKKAKSKRKLKDELSELRRMMEALTKAKPAVVKQSPQPQVPVFTEPMNYYSRAQQRQKEEHDSMVNAILSQFK